MCSVGTNLFSHSSHLSRMMTNALVGYFLRLLDLSEHWDEISNSKNVSKENVCCCFGSRTCDNRQLDQTALNDCANMIEQYQMYIALLCDVFSTIHY